MSKLFDDASLAMIPSAYKDGRLYSIRPVQELGDELVANGGFDSGTGWSTPSGWSISSGTLQGTNVAAVSATQGGYSFLNKSFRVEYTITEISQGDVRIYLGGTQSTPNRNAVGTYVEYIDITTANSTLYIQGINNFTGKIDNISVKEVLTSGDFTFSRGSNLAATRVDVNGLIEKGRENLLLQSNQFDTTPFLTLNSNVTGGQSGYDGSTDAWELNATAAAGRLYQSIVHSGVLSFSMYAKKGTADGVRVRFDQTSDTNVYVDLRDGSVASSGNTIAIDVQDVSNGWYRITFAFLGSGMTTLILYPTDGGVTSIAGSIYIQDAQLEKGLVATDYIETGASTAQAGILEDMPRLDYSGSCPALLLEPQRTNVVVSSEYFAGSDYDTTNTNATITSNATISPEGKVNATSLVANGTSALHYMNEAVYTATSGVDYTFTIFAKSNGSDYIQIATSNGFASAYQNYNLLTGALASGDAQAKGHSVDIEGYGNGWYRLIYTATTTSTSARFLIIPIITDTTRNPVFAGNGNGAYIFGAQREQGSYPTSYIPTYGSSVTRSRDNASIVNSSIPNASQGTIFCEYKMIEVFNGPELKSGGNRVVFYGRGNTAQMTYIVSRDGVEIVRENPVISGLNTNENNKYAFTWSLDGYALYINGVKEESGDLSNVPSALTEIRIYDVIKQFALFPTALTDSECIALTTI